jgi:hypothetical protein
LPDLVTTAIALQVGWSTLHRLSGNLLLQAKARTITRQSKIAHITYDVTNFG